MKLPKSTVTEKCKVTGQLGDVMKESVQIALTLVKSMFPEEAEVLKEADLHIHVPAGAVPKDRTVSGYYDRDSIDFYVTEQGNFSGVCHDG